MFKLLKNTFSSLRKRRVKIKFSKFSDDFFKALMEDQKLSGRVRLLEEQQEIMHNFLVAINKYLVKKTDTDKRCDIIDRQRNEEYLASDEYRIMKDLLNETEKPNGL